MELISSALQLKRLFVRRIRARGAGRLFPGRLGAHACFLPVLVFSRGPQLAEYVVEFGRDGGRVESDGRLDAPAFHRNHEPLWAALEKHLAGLTGNVVEVGSGTGQHVVHFARHTPGLIWWPSDLNQRHLKSIEAWRVHSGLQNIRSPLRIDLTDPDWCPEMRSGQGPTNLAAVFCANVIHIAPWSVAEGLFAGAGRYLAGRRQAVPLRPVQARRQAHRAQQRRVRHLLARRQSRMGRA